MKVLIYIRPWNRDKILEIGDTLFKNYNKTTISDFKNCGDLWIKKLKYKQLIEISKDEISDIIRRCRYLRSINVKTAEKLVLECYSKIYDVFNNNKFEYCLIGIPDCYTMDIICRIAKKQNIQVISFVKSFITGYSRFTVYGEGIKCREILDENEVNRVYDMLENVNFKPTFELNKIKSKYKLYKYYIYRRFIQWTYFPIKKMTCNDYYNYHYNTKLFTKSIRNYLPFNLEKFFKKNEEIIFEQDDVYLPLHYTPEATVDYWAINNKHANYENFILDFIRNSDSNIRFIIKEHPAKYGMRDIDFYKNLKKFENVILIHPYENSNMILNNVKNVLITTGSVGVEAIIRGKNVFFTTENYYSFINQYKIVDRLTSYDLNSIGYKVDKKKFLEDLLKLHFPIDIDDTDFSRKIKEYFEYIRGSK